MNRRNFFTTMAALPFVGSAITAMGIQPDPKKVVMSTDYGKSDYRNAENNVCATILSPTELRQNGIVPVATPCFLENGVGYTVKTWRLKTYCDGTPDMRTILNAKKLVLHEIKRLQLTHVYLVAFNPCPVIMPDWQNRYCAFVRGRRLKPWDFNLPNPCFGLDSYDAKSA